MPFLHRELTPGSCKVEIYNLFQQELGNAGSPIKILRRWQMLGAECLSNGIGVVYV